MTRAAHCSSFATALASAAGRTGVASYGGDRVRLIVPQGILHITRRVPEILEDASNELPHTFRAQLARLLSRLKDVDRQVKELEIQIADWHCDSELSRKLADVPGISPITASAAHCRVDQSAEGERFTRKPEPLLSNRLLKNPVIRAN